MRCSPILAGWEPFDKEHGVPQVGELLLARHSLVRDPRIAWMPFGAS